MKNTKMVTKIGIGFALIDALLIFSLYTGYTAAKQMTLVENPSEYLSTFATITAVEFVLTLILTCGIAIGLVNTIRRTLSEVTKASKSLAAGKVDIKLEKTSNDEFGMLIDDLQQVVDNIRNDAKIIQEVADGNLLVEVHPKSEEDVLGNALKKLVQQNHYTLSTIRDSAGQVNASTTQVASASEALAQGSTEQASAIEQITASITEVADKTRQNATEANAAAELIAKTIEDVKKGNVEMEEMVVAMQDINKASEGISKIIKVIDDIAFQTNILALNAAVEAARAGEAGKGFAVVAEEVRNLAAKSSSAAAETAEMIADSIQKVEVGSQIANETAEALEEITNAVKRSETIITEIAAASNYQATAIIQIEQAINQVSQVVQTNSATSEECAAASQELAAQVERVRELMSVFKLGGAPQMSNSMGYRYDNADKGEAIPSLKSGYGKY